MFVEGVKLQLSYEMLMPSLVKVCNNSRVADLYGVLVHYTIVFLVMGLQRYNYIFVVELRSLAGSLGVIYRWYASTCVI